MKTNKLWITLKKYNTQNGENMQLNCAQKILNLNIKILNFFIYGGGPPDPRHTGGLTPRQDSFGTDNICSALLV